VNLKQMFVEAYREELKSRKKHYSKEMERITKFKKELDKCNVQLKFLKEKAK